MKEKIIKVFGDSHARIFRKLTLPGYKIDCESISGATITGLPKRISTLNVKSNIVDYIMHNDPQYIILKFGQVDIDLKYPYYIINGNDTRGFIEKVVNSYEIFLNEIIKIYDKKKIIIYGINPPSLLKLESYLEYIGRIIHIDTYAKQQLFLKMSRSLKERVEISRRFNHQIHQMCKRLNINYNEVFEEFLDCNGVTSTNFTTDRDHHLRGIEMIIPHMNRL